jgi:membrane protein implicated in regulation of membrane protease activity
VAKPSLLASLPPKVTMRAMTWLWVGVALAFGVGEMLTLAFYAVFVVVGALAAAVAALLGVSFEGQVIVFAVVSVLGVVAARPPLMHYLRQRQGPMVVSGAEGMIGEEAAVVDDILDSNHPGHVHLLGENWPALSENGEPIHEGSTVRVTGLKQATLLVALVDATQPHVPPAGSPVTKEG